MSRPESKFYDTLGRLTVWPKKQDDKEMVVAALSTKFAKNRTYTENEVNQVLKAWHTFTDWPLLRRELIERGYMTRDREGQEYRLSSVQKD